MKKSPFPARLLLFTVGLGVSGCPVYESNDVGCFHDQDCAAGYLCDGDSGSCYADPGRDPNACKAPGNCGTNETCSRSGTCMAGDCHFASVGCVSGYVCSSSSGRWECLEQGPGTSGGASSGGVASSTGGEPGATTGGELAVLGSAGAGG